MIEEMQGENLLSTRKKIFFTIELKSLFTSGETIDSIGIRRMTKKSFESIIQLRKCMENITTIEIIEDFEEDFIR